MVNISFATNNLKEKIPIKIRVLFPAFSFIAGVIWDLLTFGKAVKPGNLLFLFIYYALSMISITVLSKKTEEKISALFTYILQFCLGSIFSALFILYFKSAGSYISYLFVALLAILLVINEFFHLKIFKKSITLYLTIFCFCGIMYLNFAIPHLIGSIDKIWFYISTFTGFFFAVLIRYFSTQKNSTLYPAVILTVLIILLYEFNIIPPVPLVLKNSLCCTNFKRDEGRYECSGELMTIFEETGLLPPTVRIKENEKVYFLSSVFAPGKSMAEIQHIWFFYNEVKKVWEKTDTIEFGIRGGRENGWRLFSSKLRLSEGLWKVVVSLKERSALGFQKFRIVKENVEAIPRKTFILE